MDPNYPIHGKGYVLTLISTAARIYYQKLLSYRIDTDLL